MADRAPRPDTLAQALCAATAELAALGLDAPRLSAELLAAKALGLTRLGVIMRSKDFLAGDELALYRSLVARRAKGEPVAYLLGEKEFYGLNLRVSPDVLIPRPETELLVEEALRLFPSARLRLFPSDAPLRFADLGTGSGALAVALAHVFPNSRGLAVDVSPQALAVARENGRAQGVEDRLDFLCADFTSLVLPAASLDLIVANPPYVTEAEYALLSHEVRGFEPGLALVSPDAGLAHIRALAPVAAQALKPGGALLCEFGSSQGRAVLEIFRDPALGLAQPVILRDYAGLDRVLRAQRAEA
ncbi:MAG: peptide chain release factor N(5)-glutamine methyltransferase [Humidesulfovibrio sp.]|nr:peptide chain release factor N(5)-glutamine methyltransferase [Humidesulfovibrio sp.]